MYVLFEQREFDAPGAAFVDGAWDRFYRDLDRTLPTSRAIAAKPRAKRSDAGREEPSDESSGCSFQVRDGYADRNEAVAPGAA